MNINCFAQNFTTINWTTAASQKYNVSEAQGKVVNGKLYSFGGFDSQKPTFTPTKRSYVYNPDTNLWTAIANLPFTPTSDSSGGITHAGIATDGTNIYLASGYTSNTAGTGQIFGTRQVWKYNVASNTYTKMPDLPAAIASGQLEYLNGILHYMGGTNSARTIDLATHYALNVNNLAAGWITLAPVPNARNHAGSAVLNGKIYFIGGQHGQDSKLVTQKEVDVYDPSTNAWAKLADLPVPAGANGRGHISSSVTVMGNRILVLGAEIVHQTSVNMVSAYTPATNTWENLTPLPANRFSGVAGNINGLIYYTSGSKTKTTYKGTPQTQTGTTTTTLSPVADAYVRNGNYAAINYGTDTALYIKSSTSAGFTKTSYLKFSLGNLANITSAKLRLFGRNVDNSNTCNVAVYGVNIDTWVETGLIFNNAPSATTPALDTLTISSVAKYYEVDITAHVQAQFARDKTVSLFLKDPFTKNTNLVFNSRENKANKPQLIITSSATPSNSIVNSIATDYIHEEHEKPIVFPNPSKGIFNLQFSDHSEGLTSIDIYDQAGKIYNIDKIRVPHGGLDVLINVSKLKLKPGVYYLRIKGSERLEQFPIIIQQ
ncbi:MAG: kelch repeat-containing protein [Ginsengibacter sp.]